MQSHSKLRTLIASVALGLTFYTAAPVLASSPGTILPISKGGTGSSTKNFVDLTTTQTVAGTKTFSGAPAVLQLTETAVRTWALRAGGLATNNLDIADITAGATRVVLNSTGDLGLGVTPTNYSGYTSLAIGHATNGGNIDLKTGATTHAQFLCTATGTYIGTSSDTPLILKQNEAEAARVDADGNLATVNDLRLTTVGKGIYIKEGTNATMGTEALVGGTKTISTTKVTANSRIFLTSQVDGGTPGFLRVSARNAGTDFTITSSSGTDTSTVAWVILEPSP
jgi:hypothetical protein